MIRLKVVLSMVAIVSATCACENRAAISGGEATSGVEAVEPQPNYQELALVEMAHKKFGESNTYRNETITDKDGTLRVCGEMFIGGDPQILRYYEYSLESSAAYIDKNKEYWASRCDYGWKVGVVER